MNEHDIYAGMDTSSCEDPIDRYRIIEGIGSFHLFRSGISNPSGMGDETKLVAYQKRRNQVVAVLLVQYQTESGIIVE